ncbi:MAG: hypothetical protein ACI9RO_000947 [Alteromonas macleodii]|jgi:hypothetical protein
MTLPNLDTPNDSLGVEDGANKLSYNQYQDCVAAELKFIRSMGSKTNLTLMASNMAAYEVVLMLLSNPVDGIPVYKAILNAESNYSSQSGILKRIKLMRDAGLIETTPGKKASEVCLVPSAKLLADYVPLLTDKHANYNKV